MSRRPLKIWSGQNVAPFGKRISQELSKALDDRLILSLNNENTFLIIMAQRFPLSFAQRSARAACF